MTKREARSLLNRYQKGTSSPEEDLLLEAWLAHTIAINDSQISEEVDEDFKKKVWNKVAPKHLRNPPKLIYVKLSMAAVLFALVCTLALQFNKSSRKTAPELAKNHIPAAWFKATLALANGRRIDLNSAKIGSIDTQQNVMISKSDTGEIKYVASPNGNYEQLNATDILSTPKGGQYQLRLSDGSKVYLNAESKLSYPARFTGQKRIVKLEGEAYFEIAKNADQPFIVEYSGQQVIVHGTHFNIYAYTNTPALTTLAEGSVTVSSLGGSAPESLTLTPGQQAFIESGKLTMKYVDAASVIAWKNGWFEFDDMTLKEALQQISRWYDVKIDESDIPEIILKCRLSKNFTLPEIIVVLNNSNNLALILEHKTIKYSKPI